MKVVIDIPEILLDRIKSAKCVPDMYGSDIVNTVVCVRNSTPYEDRPRGEWIPFEWDDKYLTKIPLPKGSDSHMEEYWDEEFMCSVCGKSHHARNFCPNCGADMRKEGESN